APVGSGPGETAGGAGDAGPSTPIRHRESLTSASEEVRMAHRHGGITGPDQRAPSRRDFLKAAGLGAVGTVVVGGVVGGVGRGARPAAGAATRLALIGPEGGAHPPNPAGKPPYLLGVPGRTADPRPTCSPLPS